MLRMIREFVWGELEQNPIAVRTIKAGIKYIIAMRLWDLPATAFLRWIAINAPLAADAWDAHLTYPPQAFLRKTKGCSHFALEIHFRYEKYLVDVAFTSIDGSFRRLMECSIVRVPDEPVARKSK